MINTLIFDFGDVFINLDKQGAMQNALHLFELDDFDDDMINTNMAYEIGAISTETFIAFYLEKFPYLSATQIIDAWNFILKDFPRYRLNFIQDLAHKANFKLILLSNTNTMHIDFIKSRNPDLYEAFKGCFDNFYLSHEIQLRKPDKTIFEFVVKENNINANTCLFIDDTKENTVTAKTLGMHVWNINESTEDVIDLFNIKADLF